MAEYWSFLNRLRHDLGMSYTVAEEHRADPRQINVLVLRKRRDEILTIVTDTRWLALLVHENPPATRVEYKHLVTMVRNFFANPEALPDQSFPWPGTHESREELRRILNPRRRFQPL